MKRLIKILPISEARVLQGGFSHSLHLIPPLSEFSSLKLKQPGRLECLFVLAWLIDISIMFISHFIMNVCIEFYLRWIFHSSERFFCFCVISDFANTPHRIRWFSTFIGSLLSLSRKEERLDLIFNCSCLSSCWAITYFFYRIDSSSLDISFRGAGTEERIKAPQSIIMSNIWSLASCDNKQQIEKKKYKYSNPICRRWENMSHYFWH